MKGTPPGWPRHGWSPASPFAYRPPLSVKVRLRFPVILVEIKGNITNFAIILEHLDPDKANAVR